MKLALDKQATKESFESALEYSAGMLIWKKRGIGIKHGCRAGTLNQNGYRQIVINQKLYPEHRVIFMMHHGFIPEFIDHIDGNRSNNLIENLRACSKSENNRNAKLNNRNKTGVKGVFFDNTGKKWCGRIWKDGRFVLNRRYDSLEVAKEDVAREREKAHGAFARHC